MATPAVSFGCAIGQIAPGHIAEFAQRAEALGYDRLVTGEHVQDGTPPSRDCSRCPCSPPPLPPLSASAS